MFELVSCGGTPFLHITAGSTALKKGQLVKYNSGVADAVAAEHSGATILGLCMEDAEAGAEAYVARVGGQILKIPYYASASDQTLADADLGKIFDINVASGVMTLDTDDTSGFCILTRYDNANAMAYVTIPATLLYTV